MDMRFKSLMYVIGPCGPTGLHRNRHARLGDELLRGLVEADQRMGGVARPLVDVANVLHGGDERAVGLGRDDPLLLQMRPESDFFSSTRPIVESLACSTMASATTFSSSSRSVQRACPSGGADVSAFDKIRAFKRRYAGLFLFRISVAS